MGRLAKLAEDHYREHLPQVYAGIRNRPTYFRQLELDAQGQIETLETSLAERDVPPWETFQEKAGRLRMARFQAEELVLRELVLPDPASLADDPDPMRPLPPEDAELADAMRQFREAQAELTSR